MQSSCVRSLCLKTSTRTCNSNRNVRANEGNSSKKSKDNQPTVPLRAEDCTSYCHSHGYQNSHTSAHCKVMANQKQNFTVEMHKATGPNKPPGGSKLVRGREPIVVGQANMMSSFVDDKTEAAPAPTHQSSSTSQVTLPSLGFFDEEYVQGKRTVSPPATPGSAERTKTAETNQSDRGIGTRQRGTTKTSQSDSGCDQPKPWRQHATCQSGR
jgi:hypothetical protein